MWRLLVILLGIALLLMPVAAFAQEAGGDDNFMLVAGRDVKIVAGDQVATLVVFDADVTIEGSVRDTLVLVNGTAVVTGTVGGDLYVFNGTLDLRETANVENVTLYRSDLTRAAGATIGGALDENPEVTFSWGTGWLFWLMISVAFVAAGLLFAAVGGRQLAGAAYLVGGAPGQTILTALIAWIALPVVAVLTMITVVGIPLGIGVLVFLLPALWFTGYLVTGAALGGVLMHLFKATDRPERPYGAVALGLLLFQAVGWIPGIGWLVMLLAGQLGAGALIYRTWNLRHGAATTRATTTPVAPAI